MPSYAAQPIRWTNNLGAAGFGPEDDEEFRKAGYDDNSIRSFLTSNRQYFGEGGMNVNPATRARLGLGNEFANDLSGKSDEERGAAARTKYNSYLDGLKKADANSSFTTVPGQMTNSGLSGLTALAGQYKDNETIGGLVAGTLADTFKTQVNTGSALAYNDAFLGSLGKYQQGLETLKKGNAMELMAAEGRIAKDLQSDQLSTTRYLGDRELEGTKYKSDSEERQIGLTGAEARKLEQTKTDQTLALRRDARGAIARSGQRFFG